MKRCWIKTLLLAVSISPILVVNPLTKKTVQGIESLGSLAGGMAAFIASPYIISKTPLKDKLSDKHSIIVSTCFGVAGGVMSWLLLDALFSGRTPENKYQFIQQLIASLELDLKDNKKDLYKSLNSISQIKEILEDIVHEIAPLGDQESQKLCKNCKDILSKLVEQEQSIEQKIFKNGQKATYKNACTTINQVKNDSLVQRDFDDTTLMAHAQVRFGTTWPLIEARNAISKDLNLFRRVSQAQQSLQLLLDNKKTSTKLIKKCQESYEQATIVMQRLELCMQMILTHPEYDRQEALYEAERMKKQDQQAYLQLLEKDREHQRQLEMQRQRHEREMKECDALQRREEQRRKEKKELQDRELKKELVTQAANPHIYADIKL